MRAALFEGLLTREEFARRVLARHGGHCAFCAEPAIDAHHILDRKLFANGGYFLANGAPVCERHHWDCETTTLSVEQVRAASGIVDVVLPDGFMPALRYDKWGNRFLDEGAWAGYRVAGPLFNDIGARRALARGGFIHLVLSADVLPQGE